MSVVTGQSKPSQVKGAGLKFSDVQGLEVTASHPWSLPGIENFPFLSLWKRSSKLSSPSLNNGRTGSKLQGATFTHKHKHVPSFGDCKKEYLRFVCVNVSSTSPSLKLFLPHTDSGRLLSFFQTRSPLDSWVKFLATADR